MPSSSTQKSSPGMWKTWSIPVDIPRMRQRLCGLLNRLTRANFNAVCDKVVEWAIRLDRYGDHEALATFVRDIFTRGLSDHIRCSLYASLCQRIVDELEGERSLWKKVDPYHLGNPVHSFETDIRLLAHNEFYRIMSTEEPPALIAAMSFAGELVVHGVVFSEDLQEVVDALFDRAERDDQETTVALCRFLARVVCAFDAYRILSSLRVVDRMEQVLKQDTLSQRTRFLLMSMLEQVVFPRPQDAFSSTRDRVDVYGIELDDSDAESVDAEDRDMDEERIRRTCSLHADAFIISHEHSQIVSLLQALRPHHRTLLIQELLAAAMQSNDTSDAFAVGSLLSSRIVADLCREADSLNDSLRDQLRWLEDIVLDVPYALRLVAHVLQGIGLPIKVVERMVTHSLPRGHQLIGALLTEIQNLQDHSDPGNDGQDSADEGCRRNRFERTASRDYCYEPTMSGPAV